MWPDGNRILCMIDTFPGLDLYHADPAQHIITAGFQVLHDLDDLQ